MGVRVYMCVCVHVCTSHCNGTYISAGAGIIYARTAASESVGPVDNNGLIIASSYAPSLVFDCVLNSSQSGVGMITGRDGSRLNHLDPLSGGGKWSIINRYSRPGMLRVRASVLSSGDQGVYSCTIPDDNGVNTTINVGLYPNGYQGE